jgi:tRNA1Val (adenine37-N6)-methyltransferase
LPAFTTETFFNARVTVRQPGGGYRFSLDSIILAAHVRPGPGEHLLDIGTGVGIIPLILGFRHPDLRITGVEIQEDLADLARANAEINGMDHRITILDRDIRTLSGSSLPAPVDRIVSNPPYLPLGSGRLNPHRGRAQARHEVSLSLRELAAVLESLLAPRGRCHLIYPAERGDEAALTLAGRGIRTLWTRQVHTLPGKSPKRVILTGVRDSGVPVSPEIRPPLFVHDAREVLTPEVQAMFEPC